MSSKPTAPLHETRSFDASASAHRPADRRLQWAAAIPAGVLGEHFDDRLRAEEQTGIPEYISTSDTICPTPYGSVVVNRRLAKAWKWCLEPSVRY
jgi:hypothetical protein